MADKDSELSRKDVKKTILVPHKGARSPSVASKDESTKRKKSVSFNEKKNYETKKYSIEAEIRRRSIDAQRKNVIGSPAKVSPKKAPKDASGLVSEQSEQDKSDIGKDEPPKNKPEINEVSKNSPKDSPKASDNQDDKSYLTNSEKQEKSVKIKKKRSPDDMKKDSTTKNDDTESNRNEFLPDGESKSKSKAENTSRKSDFSKDTKNSKRDKEHSIENETSEATSAKKGRKKSIVSKDKKQKKNSTSDDKISDEPKGKTVNIKDKRRKSSTLAHNSPKHTKAKKLRHEVHEERTMEHEEEDEEEHHHHHHRHPHGHPDSGEIHHHEHHDSNEEHAHHHHHKKKDKKNKLKDIHFHAHRTREQRTWVTEMRGYSSEPVLPLPFERKFTKIKTKIQLKPYMKRLRRKYLSMDDIFLGHHGYPNLLKETVVDPSIKTYAVREEMLKSWDELFELERRRYSFFDELFAKGYILDSLEIPSDASNRVRLVAAEAADFRANLEFGRAVFKTKNIYTGEFKDKHFHGVGRYQWIDGTVYEGHFNKGIMHGHGKIEWKDGSLYEGEFNEGTRSGWGIYSTILGYTYLGTWENGLPHGPGKMWYDIRTDNTDYYDGHWLNGIQDGNGTRQYANGDRYIGQFSGGVRNGKGTMIWLNERQVYKGHWVNGVPHGFGTHIWYLTRTNTSSFPTRHTYRGQWVDGKREGIGKMIYPCGSVYEGRWKDGQRFAKGIFVNPAGELLVGLFRAGSVCGGTEVPLHAPPYECDYTGLVQWINSRFHLDETDNLDHKLHKIVSKHLELFRKLYKRAGQLGQSWGNNGLFPSWLKRENRGNGHDDYPVNMEEPPHMRGKDKKPHNPDNVYPVFRFGMWLILKDVSGLLDTVTMAHYDKLWSECPSLSFQTLHSPFEPVYLWQFLQCFIIVAVSFYIDVPNRKYKLRLVSEERKKRKIEAAERLIEKNLKMAMKKPSSPTLSDINEEFDLDPCAQWIRDHQFKDDEDEFEDDEENEDEEEEAIQETRSNASEMYDGDSEMFEMDDEETTERRRISIKAKYEKYYNGIEDPGEGYLESISEFDSKSRNDFKKEEKSGDDDDDDDDDYSTMSYSTDGKESTVSVESDGDAAEQLPLTILNAFELLIDEKLLKVVKRPPGKHLPRVPDPLPSISDLYYAFKSVNNTDVITGKEFLLSTVPHGVFPNPEESIYWHRSKEILSSKLDLEYLIENFQSTVAKTPEADEEANTLGEEFLGSTINTAEAFTAKLKNEAEPEFERSHRTTVEILNHERINTVFNVNFPEGDEADGLPYSTNNDDGYGYRREKFSVVRDPDEMFAESNPFDDADLAKEPFLYTQTRNCDRVQRKAFNKRWLGAHDVTRVFRRVYPKLADTHHKSNIPSKMVFCDWLWCVSLCARISADREFLSVVNDSKRQRPRLFHTAPHIGIHSPTQLSEKWKHPTSRLGDSLYYLGEKKELLHVKYSQ